MNRQGGIVTLQPVLDKVDEVRQSVESLTIVANRTATASERTSAELALGRLEQEKKGLETLGKIGMFVLLFGVIAGYAYRNYFLMGGGIVIGGGLVYLWLQSFARITKQENDNRKIVNSK